MNEPSLWLTPDEVGELTGCPVRWSAQCRKLAAMNIPFIVNGAGRPLVERAAVEIMRRKPPARKPFEPNWAALDEARAARKQRQGKT